MLARDVATAALLALAGLGLLVPGSAARAAQPQREGDAEDARSARLAHGAHGAESAQSAHPTPLGDDPDNTSAPSAHGAEDPQNPSDERTDRDGGAPEAPEGPPPAGEAGPSAQESGQEAGAPRESDGPPRGEEPEQVETREAGETGETGEKTGKNHDHADPFALLETTPHGPREASAATLHEPPARMAAPKALEGPVYIDAGHTLPITLTPSAHYYLRSQGRYNAEHDPAPGDHRHNIFQRVRLGLLASAGPVSAFVQVQDVREWGFARETIDNQANVDLFQGYLEFERKGEDHRFFVRLGRQMIQVGSRRLIADRNWHPVGQSFDGLRIHAERGRFGADLGVMILAHARQFTADLPDGEPLLTAPIDSPGSYAAYAQLFAHLGPQLNLEALAIGLFERPTPWAPADTRDILNGGLRIFGEPHKGVTYDVEAYGQGGRDGARPHRAWAAMGSLGYSHDHKYRLGGHLRYNYASGQACVGDPEAGCGGATSTEFHRLFGLRHAYYGIVDRVAHSNLREFEVSPKIRAHEKVKINLSYHFIQLDQPTGAWRNAPGELLGAGWDPLNRDRNLGHELDLILNYWPMKPLTIQPGYGVFFPLGAARRLAGPAPQHFVYLWILAYF